MPSLPPRPALARERHDAILRILARDGSVRLAELVSTLNAAPATVRRDLAHLEQRGKLTRVHGGAILDVAPAAPPSEPLTHSIGIVIPSLTYYWPTVVAGIERVADAAGYRTLVRGTSYETQDERPLLERLRRDPTVQGLIVAPNPQMPHYGDVLQWLTAAGVPVVLSERHATLGGLPLESVTTDHLAGTSSAVRHLYNLGHRRIGLVVSQLSPPSMRITEAWVAACNEFDLDPQHRFESALPSRIAHAYTDALSAALDKVLAIGLTALLVHPDHDAMSLVDHALARGIRVPGDLSIIAYDDEVAQMFSPPLTAVRPAREAIGEAAAELLIRRIADRGRPVHQVLLSPEMHVRETTGRVPAIEA